MRPILHSDFRIVEGPGWWPLIVLRAREMGVLIPVDIPRCIVVLWGGRWIAGVGVIEHGPLLMFEWLVLDHRGPRRARHAALEVLMLAGKRYAAGVGKRPVMVVDRRRGGVGIRKMAERLGFASRNEHLEVLEGT